MAKKAALGKGLSALLPTAGLEEAKEGGGGLETSRLYRFEERMRFVGRVAELDVETIQPNPYQPRLHFDETALDELSRSIQQLGIIQPVTVRALGDGQFQIISGERRLRAAKRAGVRKIPAYVREADTEAMLEMALVENVQRQDLNPIETALGYQRLIEECDLTQDKVAEKVGKNRSTVSNFLRLLKLPPRVQASLRDGDLSTGHARVLVSLDNTAVQYAVLDRILDEGLSVRQVEQLARDLSEPPAPPEPKSAQETADGPSLEQLQVEAFTNRLRSHFSTMVNIKRKSDGSGKLELSYYSDEDLERILELLLPSAD
ncbi:MAG: ParB/RepB/Spo0J family partition protein [Bacteroidota bacterium]